jgi:hypothetical protein
MNTSVDRLAAAKQLDALAEQAVERALAAGACDAEAVAFAGEEFAVHVLSDYESSSTALMVSVPQVHQVPI